MLNAAVEILVSTLASGLGENMGKQEGFQATKLAGRAGLEMGWWFPSCLSCGVWFNIYPCLPTLFLLPSMFVWGS